MGRDSSVGSLMRDLNLGNLLKQEVGRDSSVGIATDYGLEGLGSNPGGDDIFCPLQTGLGTHPTSCTTGTGSFPGVEAAGTRG